MPIIETVEGAEPQRPASAKAGASALAPTTWCAVDEWASLLQRLSISPRLAAYLLATAHHRGSTVPDELLFSGLVDEATLYREIAISLGLPFRDGFAPGELRVDVADALALLKSGSCPLVQVVGQDGFIAYVASPKPAECQGLRDLVRRSPMLVGRISIAPPSVVRRALIAIATPRLKEIARDGLFTAEPRFSARFVVSGWQGAMLGAIAVAVPVAFAIAPDEAFLALHLCATVFFMSCVVLRLAAAVASLPPPGPPPEAFDPANAPVYTILVALRDEVEVVPELLASLGRLSWPRSRLQVVFICEDDDRRTIDALRTAGLRPWAEIIEVPRGMPATKPNALTFALALTHGELVAVYDAEDRPHPMQLWEAWGRFRGEDHGLACLQAPLRIDNGAAGILPRMFALEYAALFGRFLPYLAQRGLVLPLGGTSNHFRRAALEEVGAWDPYNVTEDADLGVRLARHGYRSGVIHAPTGEDAPERAMVWVKQRSRWLKGWAQTWLVHMRDPAGLKADLGIGSFVGLQVLLAGLLLSSLLHPVLLFTGGGLAAKAVAGGGLPPAQVVLFALDVFNIALGYGAFLLLGWRSAPAERRDFWKMVLYTPLYWMMMSVAAWRALEQLLIRPHHWEKTPHARRRERVGRRPARITATGAPFPVARRDGRTAQREPERTAIRSPSPQRPRKLGPSPMIFGSSMPITAGSLPA
jgi:cellulose synthase/poly-beta-1,6-N-acetylglucosamine synthase-like glycosyltransferase